jgi:hypothetical protein
MGAVFDNNRKIEVRNFKEVLIHSSLICNQSAFEFM